MDYKRLFGFGIAIWIVAFLVASIFVATGQIDSLAAKIVVPIAVGAAAFLIGRKLKPASAGDALRYSAAWVVIVILLDAAITVPFAGWQIFAQWNVWLGLLLVLTMPVVAARR
jgi:hypothetical protein